MARFFQPKKRSALETKHQAVSVQKLDHLGAGIAYLDKKPVFIDGALADEEVLIQLTESKSKFARAKLIKVLKPSQQRTVPFCPHYAQCGGCDLQHLSRDAQIEHKQQTLSQQFGFRRKQSKEIVTVTDCAVLEPSLNALLPELKSLLSVFKKPDQLGHVELVKGDNTSVLVLRHLSPLARSGRHYPVSAKQFYSGKPAG